MKRIILYTSPLSSRFNEILKLTFPKKIHDKRLAYLPSNGYDTKQEYTDLWKKIAYQHNSDFIFIDNTTAEPSKELEKLLSSNILVITGGNTFLLLHNLKKSGLDKAIKDFAKKDDFVINAFSAGAIVLTPNIDICKTPGFDENLIRLEDLTGLNVVNFEIFPHYSEIFKDEFTNQKQKTKNDLKTISEDDYIIINK